jgi:hypothetical protein
LIDELDTLGALRADLAQYYQLNIDDVWAGRVSAWHVIVLTEQLVLNPASRVRALREGTPAVQGWDKNTDVLARTHNLIAGLIAGLSTGVNLDDILITYPTAENEEPRAPQTLAELVGWGFNEFFRQ